MIDEALTLAMMASRQEFLSWEEEAENAGFEDEFAVGEPDNLPEEWRFRLVARLIRSIAMAYGIGTDYGTSEVGQVQLDQNVLATPLRELLQTLTERGDDEALAGK